ncbi:hypothetical protein [Gilvibacter sediminis]|uniref:hypothetical protein n=1 Tax=Gilvibacter sediminis TaxID=379071 RepID=UPI00234FB5F0|nr:hypothetical protein [Gilvibacter sediminis]
MAVENAIGFKNGFNTERLTNFYRALWDCRTTFHNSFEALNDPDGRISKINNSLLTALKLDLPSLDELPSHSKATPPLDKSHTVGVFYVLAGSAMGARVIRNMALAQNAAFKSNYLDQLIATAGEQMKLLQKYFNTVGIDEDRLICGAKDAFDLILNSTKIGGQTEYRRFQET